MHLTFLNSKSRSSLTNPSHQKSRGKQGFGLVVHRPNSQLAGDFRSRPGVAAQRGLYTYSKNHGVLWQLPWTSQPPISGTAVISMCDFYHTQGQTGPEEHAMFQSLDTGVGGIFRPRQQDGQCGTLLSMGTPNRTLMRSDYCVLSVRLSAYVRCSLLVSLPVSLGDCQSMFLSCKHTLPTARRAWQRYLWHSHHTTYHKYMQQRDRQNQRRDSTPDMCYRCDSLVVGIC